MTDSFWYTVILAWHQTDQWKLCSVYQQQNASSIHKHHHQWQRFEAIFTWPWLNEIKAVFVSVSDSCHHVVKSPSPHWERNSENQIFTSMGKIQKYYAVFWRNTNSFIPKKMRREATLLFWCDELCCLVRNGRTSMAVNGQKVSDLQAFLKSTDGYMYFIQ